MSHYCCSKCNQRYDKCTCTDIKAVQEKLTYLEEAAKNDDLEPRYLETCAAWEKKSLEVSRAAKALELLKKELSSLAEVRENMRRRLVGDVNSAVKR
jgi:hypothetical protein